jgi:hypothetical protein
VAKSVTRTWYRVALARAAGEPLLVAVEGEHLGAAVAAAEHHAGKGAYAIAAEIAAEDQIPLGESVGKDRVVEFTSAPAADVTAFRWPLGVLPRLSHPFAAPVRRGYASHPDPRLLVIEAQTDRDHVTDLFLGLVERLPVADNLEIRLLDHFDDAATTDVWLTARVDAKRILRFLDDHDELIENGHVELSIYVRAHKATLKLTEHKTVVWLAEDGALEAEVTKWLRELEVPRVSPLVTVTAVPHLHFRPAKARDRAKLADYLFRQRLRRVDQLPAPGR